jgi:hypothetical protein
MIVLQSHSTFARMCEKCAALNEFVPIGAPRTTAIADGGTALSSEGRWFVKMDSIEGETTQAPFAMFTSKPTRPAHPADGDKGLIQGHN